METKDYLQTYYQNYDEENRLTTRYGRVEFLTTMRYIENYLRPGMRILEIGAATGRYSHTLARKGYQVDAVELLEHNIELFRQNTAPAEPVTITQGNATDLSAFSDNTYEITLLLGPMYHLFTEEEKLKAIAEKITGTPKKLPKGDRIVADVIYRDGTIHDGRPMDLIGAHCAAGGHNNGSIGVCYIGGLENNPGVPYAKLKAKDTRTHMQKIALLSVLMELKEYYPQAKIYGHHDFDRGKDCPSFDARDEYKYL